MTLTDRRAGSDGWSGYLIRQRMQTAYWQFCFSDRFTGARNPARLPTPIQSRRIRRQENDYFPSIFMDQCGRTGWSQDSSTLPVLSPYLRLIRGSVETISSASRARMWCHRRRGKPGSDTEAVSNPSSPREGGNPARGTRFCYLGRVDGMSERWTNVLGRSKTHHLTLLPPTQSQPMLTDLGHRYRTVPVEPGSDVHTFPSSRGLGKKT
jgi:hypothetical protein